MLQTYATGSFFLPGAEQNLGGRSAGFRQPVAWLSLDENDNLFPRFFSYFIVAMQTGYPCAQGYCSRHLHLRWLLGLGFIKQALEPGGGSSSILND